MTRIDDRSYYTMRLSQERERAGRVVRSQARAALWDSPRFTPTG